MEKYILNKEQKNRLLNSFYTEDTQHYDFLKKNIDVEWSFIKTSDESFPYYFNVGLKHIDCFSPSAFLEIKSVAEHDNKLTIEDLEYCIKAEAIISGARGFGKDMQMKALRELLEYKKLEKCLGIDLGILLKGVYNFVDFIRKFRVGSVWIKNRYKDNRLEKADFSSIDVAKGRVHLVQKEGYEETGYYRETIENYDKTWAITREELL